MAGPEKYRVGNLAKDLGLKNKDVIELLAKHGFVCKSYMTQLDSPELSIVFEHYTQAHQTDIAKFFEENKKPSAVEPGGR